MEIGLTLSGGGFRATLFHLGVIQYLRAAGLLRSVTHVTSVSGGSITAAHLAVNWDRYSGTVEQFDAASRELVEFTQLGVREHVIAYLPLTTLGRQLPPRFRFDEATILRNMYSRYLFRKESNAALKRHSGVPSVNLIATNLSRPDNLVSFSGEGVALLGEQGYTIPTRQLDLSYAVTASSAFPLLFPALAINQEMLGSTAEKFNPSLQYLTDGGVYDNYGLRAIRYLRRDRPLDLLVISDAGARAGWVPNQAFNRISLLSRASAITGQRVSQLELDTVGVGDLCAKPVLVSIHEETPKWCADNLEPDLQRQLGKIRTDLDSFSDLLVHCLGSHGYAQAKNRLGSIEADAQQVPEHWNPLSPGNPTSRNVSADLAKLQKASLTPWHLFSPKEWRPLLFYLLLLFGVYWYGATTVVACVEWVVTKVHDASRASWSADGLGARVQFGDQTFLGSMQSGASEAEKEKFRKERWFRWINDGIRPTTRRQQVLVIESPPFSGYFRDFQLSIVANNQIKLSEGVAFLVGNLGSDTVPRPTYRQLTMTFDQTGENWPTVALTSPDKGEKLLIILKTESTSPDAAAVLPSSPDSFGISLRNR